MNIILNQDILDTFEFLSYQHLWLLYVFPQLSSFLVFPQFLQFFSDFLNFLSFFSQLSQFFSTFSVFFLFFFQFYLNKLNFSTVYFPKVYFLNVYSPKVYFSKVYFPPPRFLREGGRKRGVGLICLPQVYHKPSHLPSSLRRYPMFIEKSNLYVFLILRGWAPGQEGHYPSDHHSGDH